MGSNTFLFVRSDRNTELCARVDSAASHAVGYAVGPAPAPRKLLRFDAVGERTGETASMNAAPFPIAAAPSPWLDRTHWHEPVAELVAIHGIRLTTPCQNAAHAHGNW